MLAVDELHVRFRTRNGPVHAVNGASFTIDSGEVVGLVGESGCGKSVTARSILRLEDPGEITRGSVRFDGTDLTTVDESTVRRLRGQELSIVFQNPETSLNPVYTVGEQIAEALRVHRNPGTQPFVRGLLAGSLPKLDSRSTRDRVLELLSEVGIPRPEDRIDAYPHQFSGGMRQRAMLAIALAQQPSLLVADEPTTSLDTTTQAAILDRLETVNAEYGTSVLFISHDLSVVSQLCDRILVMYDGKIVESGPTERLRSSPAHPYTKALLGCVPGRSDPGETLPTIDGSPPEGTLPPTGCVFADRCPFAREECRVADQPVIELEGGQRVRCGVPDARESDLETTWTKTSGESSAAASAEKRGQRSDSRDSVANDSSVIELEGITKTFRTGDGLFDRVLGSTDRLTAVSDVSLTLRRGETLGLVGESGCGKSTLVRLIAGLEVPTSGTIRLEGETVETVDSRRADQLENVGVVFQHPETSLNPHRTVQESLAEPLLEAGWSESRVEALLSLVDLPLEYVDRFPRQLSGGQLQRVAIARALALEPSVLLLDEPTAGLDVSVQATVLNLLARLQTELDVAYLFVSHDLDVVRHVADRVATMYVGELVEVGPAKRVLSRPAHPYTATLLESAPTRDPNDGRSRGADSGPAASEPPRPVDQPAGCAFRPRCPMAAEDCETNEPTWTTVADARSRCHYATECSETATRHEIDD
ncbi:dipeptide ABC transporter ATP-binding protein [Natronorubrum halophilum]|uniref:dipeptide ABC transporter ATP-binding protein n=1 Tax=Natronorubrum halophilum TaxID=1702106 RepID=UPI000EF73111|nr:ABC transporter ATP-binding protein [Natronorubrum halophilum]